MHGFVLVAFCALACKLLQTTNLRHRGPPEIHVVRKKSCFDFVSRVRDFLLYALFFSLLFEEE